MTALSADFARAKSPDAVASSLNIPVAAATTIYQGAMVGVSIAGSGYATNVAATPDYRVLGVARANVTNTSAAGFGSAGDLNVDVDRGVFALANSSSTDAITAADVGRPCYAVDNNTVARTSNFGLRPTAGIVTRVENSLVWVEIGAKQVYEDGTIDLLAAAGADLSTTGQYLFVKLNGSNQIVLADTAGEHALGVLLNAPASSAIGIVRIHGITYVVAGGSIADGTVLATTATTARAKAAVAATVNTSDGGVSGDPVIGSYAMGTALSDGTSGNPMRMFVNHMGAIPTTAA